MLAQDLNKTIIRRMTYMDNKEKRILDEDLEMHKKMP